MRLWTPMTDLSKPCVGSLRHPVASRRRAVVVVQAPEHQHRDDLAPITAGFACRWNSVSVGPVMYGNRIARESRRFPVVVLEDATEPFPAVDRPTGIRVGGQRREQFVVQPLVIPFEMIVDQKLS